MQRFSATITLCLLLAFSHSSLAGEKSIVDDLNIIPPMPTKEDKRHWKGLWPALTDDAVSRGYDLPLPFGISASYLSLERSVEVKSVKAGFNGNLNNVTRRVSVDTQNEVQSGILKLDTFILPFLNVYAFGGKIDNQSAVDLSVTYPWFGGDRTYETRLFPDLQADLWGAGISLSGGYKNFFTTLDVTYSSTDFGGAFSERIEAFIYSSRIGYRGSIGKYTTSIFAGAAYWDTESVIKGSIPIGGNNLDFEVLQGPSNPWNAMVGAAIDFSDRWQCHGQFDFNFDDMTMLVIGTTFRF
ncbi:hypothetical protein [Persicirhabdus sediminis]|uniref:MetA-pathway of phenol degradation n=1 Tax=Persicirhabdus sediminis TaxID=454144 RepID=A0A8J7SGR4_9BACT|nr:hypothetical protein [Persicirhabdus sediminis]MBK1790290.1 hypothetical protein [Persicirhabdus sediminis]